MSEKNNKVMSNAKRNKKDEFYTQLTDIEHELYHYWDHLRGKVIYCNCDDAKTSKFFFYFSRQFEHLGLKKLITTSYNPNGHGSVLIYEGDKNGNRIVDDSEIITKELEGNGDFRSPECVELLKEADIVITNPPFSLFREYVAQLIEYNKKFLIIGNINAITYKEIFPLIKDNKMWVGYKFNGKAMEFIVPDDYELKGSVCGVLENGKKYVGVGGTCWFTNLDTKKRHEDIILWKKYTPKEFPKYDNYDAINVDKTLEIPCDYDGVMGVPISFIDKYNPSQFKIIAQMANTHIDENNFGYPFINGKKKYARILIQKL